MCVRCVQYFVSKLKFLRFPPNVSDGFSEISMTCANQLFTVSPIGFCLLELAEANMLKTLGGKSFLRLDEVKLFLYQFHPSALFR